MGRRNSQGVGEKRGRGEVKKVNKGTIANIRENLRFFFMKRNARVSTFPAKRTTDHCFIEDTLSAPVSDSPQIICLSGEQVISAGISLEISNAKFEPSQDSIPA